MKKIAKLITGYPYSNNVLKLVITFLSCLLLNMNYAKEDSRPQSSGNDNIIEINFGQIIHQNREIFEMGLDYEYFIPFFEHHISIGVASELEFLLNDEFYIGPILSFYYIHTKLYLTSGFQSNFLDKNFWKSRLGIGYEFFLNKNFIIIPSLATEMGEGKNSYVLNLGLALEY